MGCCDLKRRPLPAWLQKPRSAYAGNPGLLRAYNRHLALYWATPPWLTKQQRARMNRFHREKPAGYHVDHEVPLDGTNVCGLNVPWNLRYLRAAENIRKRANYWPDCPHENQELFPRAPEPHQLALVI